MTTFTRFLICEVRNFIFVFMFTYKSKQIVIVRADYIA